MSVQTATSKQDYSRNFILSVSIVTAIIGLIYGYDNGSISGALPFLTKEYALSANMQGAMLSITVIGSIIGAITGGRLSDALGRKKMMLFIALGYGFFALFSAIPLGVVWLLTVRFFMGLCIGTSIVVAPIFIGEFAPTKIRGSLLVAFQIAQTIGIISANFADYAFSFSGNWEFMLGLSCIPAFLIAIGIIFFPDTPRWYLMKGYREKGIATLKRIEPAENIEKTIQEIDNDINSSDGRLREMFKKDYRNATLFVIGFGFMVKITGITAITHYAPIIFESIGIGTSDSILISAFIQISSLVAEVIALLVIDRLGRRFTLLTGVGVMFISSIVMSFVFFQSDFEGSGIYAAFFSIMAFNMAFNFSLGSLVWVYASECFPARLRSLGSSLLLTSDLIANLIVSQVFLVVLDAFGGGWTFTGYAVMALIAWLFILRLAPETSGRSLEEIHHYWLNGARWSDQKQKI
ncbi:MAG TPA: sugar porter family MFS transporter [Virgibacillus sp.]|nr:sugar porter family MFS transporter [Virgibacillus sp.]